MTASGNPPRAQCVLHRPFLLADRSRVGRAATHSHPCPCRVCNPTPLPCLPPHLHARTADPLSCSFAWPPAPLGATGQPSNDSSSTLTIMTITVTNSMAPLARQPSRVFVLRGWEGEIAAGPPLDDFLQCGSAMDCVLRPASNPISVGILPTYRFCTLFLDLP